MTMTSNKTSNILFYDDDIRNIKEVSKLPIKCIFITDKQVNLNYKERHDYHKNFINNSYYNLFKPLGTPTQGFNMKYAEELLLLLNTFPDINRNDKTNVVLFDWDRTITCFDGFAIENAPFTYSSVGVKIQDVLEYICGGYTRLNLLSYVFQRIRRKCELFIVTNNPIAIHNRDEFVKMIRCIDPHFKEKCLLYGNGNKRIALVSCDHFMKITHLNNLTNIKITDI